MALCIIIPIITAHPGSIRHSDNMVIGSFFHADAVDEGNSFMTIKMGDKVRCSFCNKTRPYLFKIVDFEFIIKKKTIRNLTPGCDSKKYLIRSMFGFSLSKDILIDDLKYDEILIFF